MNSFKTLFKYEMKKQFPMFNKSNKKNIIGTIFSLLLTVVVAAATVYFLTVLTKTYAVIELNKIFAPKERAFEFANVFYLFSLVLITIFSMEKMRKSFVDESDKKIFLRMPIKQETLFLTRLLVLFITTLITSALFVFPISFVICRVVKVGAVFWINTIINFLLLPVIALLIASLLLLPYIKILDFLKNKYWLIFIVLSVLVVAVFALYAGFLNIIQEYLQTGMIKFFFNEAFISVMDGLEKFAYPSNCFAGILLGKNLFTSYLVLFLSAGIGFVGTFLITKVLFRHTLYSNELKKVVYTRKERLTAKKPIWALLKKEFILVFREPQMMFSYFVIAISMPFMVYACYTLFSSLIVNMIGITVELGLALSIVLVFSVLTNTFCATNITREGISLVKQKALPIKPEKLIGAKILLCSCVSVGAVILSVVMLMAFAGVGFINGLFVLTLGAMFSVAQILIATKMDLSHFRLSHTKAQNENLTSKTIVVIVLLGLFVAGVVGLSAIAMKLFTTGVLGFFVPTELANAIPVCLVLVYFGLSIVYYRSHLQHKLDNLSA